MSEKQAGEVEVYDFDWLADWLGAMPESENVFDITDEATTIITVGVETLARRLLAARVIRDGSAAAIARAAWASGYAACRAGEQERNPYRPHPTATPATTEAAAGGEVGM